MSLCRTYLNLVLMRRAVRKIFKTQILTKVVNCLFFSSKTGIKKEIIWKNDWILTVNTKNTKEDFPQL